MYVSMGGKLLHPEETFKTNGVRDMDTVYVRLRLRGGSRLQGNCRKLEWSSEQELK